MYHNYGNAWVRSVEYLHTISIGGLAAPHTPLLAWGMERPSQTPRLGAAAPGPPRPSHSVLAVFLTLKHHCLEGYKV